jgi:hypothetical protein
MMKKSILAVAVWYFLVMNPGGSMSKMGPFQSRIKCDTYRMRVSRFRGTSNCIQPPPPSKKSSAGTPASRP